MYKLHIFPEHTDKKDLSDKILIDGFSVSKILFNKKSNELCVKVEKEADKKLVLSTHYYIGADWLKEKEIAVCVTPKIEQVDYSKMLFSCLKHPDVCLKTGELYEMKFDAPFIQIEKKQDFLTPILVVHFLQTLKSLVRKGLKKLYYKIEKNLNARIKGKVLVGQTLKHNIIKNKLTNTFCQYHEFGYNCIENRILKHTLLFARKYLAFFPEYLKFVSPIINYCLPAFQGVNEDVDLKKLKEVTQHSFYKEYNEALHIAKLVLKRFGYTIKNITTQNKSKVETPPFWINMPKLFELYVLGLLKDEYSNNIEFQFDKTTYGKLDFLHTQEKIIIDAKYKTVYQEENKYDIDDIRQLSGYARDIKILEKLGYANEQDKVIDCLIIYPDKKASDKLDNLKKTPIKGFTKFYKMGIKLPEI